MDVDATSKRDFWLVKVPKYMANVWKNAPPNAELGKIRMPKSGIGPIKCITDPKLNQKLLTDKGMKIPDEHNISAKPLEHQKLSILARVKDPASTATNPTADKLSYEGDVTQRSEIRPIADLSYISLKSDSIIQASRPTRVTQILDKAVSSYKPRGKAQLAQEADLRRRKEEQRKVVREDKDVVQGRLFSAFEKQQYYKINDLVRITSQSPTYLKEILKELCNYCSNGTHKNMWELKPEYRHYKTTPGARASGINS